MQTRTYQDLGYTPELEQYRKQEGLDRFELGRVISEHKERYVLKSPGGELDAELIGNLRFTAESRKDFPAVGDWVAFPQYDEGKALIHTIYPRKSVLERKAAGKPGQSQIIAANIDVALLVQAVDRDFNINRLERYLTICYSARIEPFIVLSKTDLISDSRLQSKIDQLGKRIIGVPILPVSSRTIGYDSIGGLIEKGKTYCLLGSSGAGKSTLINHLCGNQQMKTGEISGSVNKGRHITSHRELVVLDQGGILIDNPGMREVGIADAGGGLETTFESILAFAQNCRFKDCTHLSEKGCAVLAALERGELEQDSYLNFRKMEKEKEHFESDAMERKRKEKEFGRMVKTYQKQRKDHKY
ncbi:MAG: ribosome small subunit-dependent GTPase A [Bacteroidales bacterium]|nr:ribosome small subunit-dependent GTPase A [Bacteroidales bacterium]